MGMAHRLRCLTIHQGAASVEAVEKGVAVVEATVDEALSAHGRKRSRSDAEVNVPDKAGMDPDIEVIAEKRVKQQQPKGNENKTNTNGDSGEEDDDFGPWGECGSREKETVPDLAISSSIEAIEKLPSRESEINIPAPGSSLPSKGCMPDGWIQTSYA